MNSVYCRKMSGDWMVSLQERDERRDRSMHRNKKVKQETLTRAAEKEMSGDRDKQQEGTNYGE